MNNKMTINADVEANGTVYANGPVFVMGMDIKSEIEKLKIELENIKEHKPEEVERVVNLLLEKYDLLPKEKSELKVALDTAIKITDWVARIQFWYDTLKLISNPFLLHIILVLIRLKIY